MRDPARIDKILGELRAYWEANPDLRLGQIIYNTHQAGPEPKVDLFYVEDDKLIQGLWWPGWVNDDRG